MKNGDRVTIEWLPPKMVGHKRIQNAYIGMKGTVEEINDYGFVLSTKTSVIVVSPPYIVKHMDGSRETTFAVSNKERVSVSIKPVQSTWSKILDTICDWLFYLLIFALLCGIAYGYGSGLAQAGDAINK